MAPFAGTSWFSGVYLHPSKCKVFIRICDDLSAWIAVSYALKHQRFCFDWNACKYRDWINIEKSCPSLKGKHTMPSPISAKQLQPHMTTLRPGAQQLNPISSVPKVLNVPGNTGLCQSSTVYILSKVKFCRHAGQVTLSRLWLKFSPKVKLWRPAGQVTLTRL